MKVIHLFAVNMIQMLIRFNPKKQSKIYIPVRSIYFEYRDKYLKKPELEKTKAMEVIYQSVANIFAELLGDKIPLSQSQKSNIKHFLSLLKEDKDRALEESTEDQSIFVSSSVTSPVRSLVCKINEFITNNNLSKHVIDYHVDQRFQEIASQIPDLVTGAGNISKDQKKCENPFKLLIARNDDRFSKALYLAYVDMERASDKTKYLNKVKKDLVSQNKQALDAESMLQDIRCQFYKECDVSLLETSENFNAKAAFAYDEGEHSAKLLLTHTRLKICDGKRRSKLNQYDEGEVLFRTYQFNQESSSTVLEEVEITRGGAKKSNDFARSCRIYGS
jgi:hypothetical protein